MSILAWRILTVFVEMVQKDYKGEWGRGYLADWEICERLGVSKDTIQSLHLPWPLVSNEHEKALKELLDKGLLEEMPELRGRYQLVFK